MGFGLHMHSQTHTSNAQFHTIHLYLARTLALTYGVTEAPNSFIEALSISLVKELLM